MISQIFYIQDFIEKNDLNFLIEWTKRATPIKDEYGNSPFSFLQTSSDESDIHNIFLKINQNVHKTIEDYFLCRVQKEDICGMIIYPVGSMLPKHIDNVPGQNIPTPTGYPSRDISSTIYYNDDYIGGEIYFLNQDLKIKPKAGSLIIFPSNENYPHEVLPVESGIRYSSTNFWSIFN